MQLVMPEALSHAKCLDVVKVFLNSSIACIAHTRELIPWTSPCFHTRFIDQLAVSNDDIYKSFCSSGETQNEGISQEVRVLIRGTDRKADQILDLIVQCRATTMSEC